VRLEAGVKFRDEFPLPDTDWPPTREFWAAAARGELALPRCDACSHFVWYPDGSCRRCGGAALTWTRVAGRGSLFSWSVVHRAFIPQLGDDVPYVAGLVALEEDPAVRLVTRIVDAEPGQLRVDLPVRAVFRPLRFRGVSRTVQAPMFAPLPA
jgi:uncharacterized OB-fold protein